MNTDSPSYRYNDEEFKHKLIAKLLLTVKKNGIAHLRADDIAKCMDLSKATVYKYFESKEEILNYIVDFYITRLIDLDFALDESCGTYQMRFLTVFKKMLMAANYGTEIFMKDLREFHPELMEKIQIAITARNNQLRRFYEQGVADGVFEPFNIDLLILQNELCMAKLVDPVVLMARNLTFRQALYDYYKLKIYQLFIPEARPSLDDKELISTLDVLAQKIASSMQ